MNDRGATVKLGNRLASAGNIFAACQSEAEASELLKDLKQERHVVRSRF